MTEFDDLRQQLNLLNDEVLLSILRERDYEQWRPEVFDIVASILRERGVSLSMDSDSKDEKEISEAPADHLDTVASYFSLADAEADLEALEAKGIRAWIFDEGEPQMEGPSDSVQLKVLPADLKAAMALLDSEPAPASTELPDEIAGPLCPKCGSRETAEESEIVQSSDGSSLSNRPTPKKVWFYRCSVCGHTWSDS